MIRSDLALAALATAAVPGMRPVSVAAIRTGEDTPAHQSALIEDVTGRTWLIRSPLGAAAGAELERNDDLVRQLGRHLPFKVPAAAGYADLGPEGRAVVYPYVEGLALSLRHLPVGPGLASAVGRAIAAVHNMPRELFEEFAVPVFDADEVRARKLSELDRAAETGHVPNGLLARWEQALDAVAMWRFATVPTHGTLDGSSFLVAFSDDSDAASGRVVGLTGWERTQVADPAEDFARLVELANPRAVDSVFESYSLARSQRPDGYLLHRARLAAEMRLLTGLAAAVGAGDEAFVRRRADELRKLDRLTASDNSLVPRTALAAATAGTDLSREQATEPDNPVGQSAESDADTVADVDTTAPVPRLPHPADDTDEQGVRGLSPDPDDDGAAIPGTQATLTSVDEPAVVGATADHAAAQQGGVEQDGVDDGVEQDGVEQDGVEQGTDDEADDEPAVVVEPPSDGGHLEPVSTADVTAPIPMFRPVSGTGPGRETRDQPDAEPATDTDSDTEPVTDTDPHTEPVTAAADTPEEIGSPGVGPDPATDAQTAEAAEAAEGDADADRAADERLHTLYGMPEESDLRADRGGP